MPGTYFADAAATNLLTGATLTAGSTTGTIVQVNWPGHVKLVLTTGTVTGGSPTLAVTLEGDETADFSGTTTRKLGSFSSVGDEDVVTHELNVYCDAKYVRASITVGGTGVYTGTTLTMQPPYYMHEKATNSAGALA
jgi:hypothetical protein